MALVHLGRTQCSLCGEVVSANDNYWAWGHFIRDRTDPLWSYSDSVMHTKCFKEWPQRQEFQRRAEQE